MFLGEARQRGPGGIEGITDHLLALYRDGLLRPHISARYPLDRGAEAIGALAARRSVGKVIVRIRDGL